MFDQIASLPPAFWLLAAVAMVLHHRPPARCAACADGLVGTTVIFFAIVNAVKLVPCAQLGPLELSNVAVSARLLATGVKLLWGGVK